MARVFDSASDEAIYSTSFAPISAEPFTMACWGKPDDFTSHRCLMHIGSASVGGHAWRLHFAITTGVARCLTYPGSGAGYADSTTGATAGTWNHACAVFAADNDRRIYLNGGNKGTDTTNIAANTPNSIYIGRGDWSSSSSYFPLDGSIFWPAVWNVALTDIEVAALGAGLHPFLVRPDALVFFSPFGGLDPQHNLDIVSGNTMSEAGTPTWNDDSPTGLIYPRRTILGVTSGSVGFTSRRLTIRKR